jgi:hypothetical protein
MSIIGNQPNQIPLNGYLGKLAFLDKASKDVINTGNTGDNIPLLSGLNTWANNQIINGSVYSNTYISRVTTGTAPLVINSTTLVANLNSDLLDGYSVGTSGSAIPRLDTQNYWSGQQIFLNTNNWFGPTTSNTSPNSAIEIGLATNHSFIDFHSSNTVVDYNARIGCTGGTAGQLGGALIYEAATHSFTGGDATFGRTAAGSQVWHRIFNGSGTVGSQVVLSLDPGNNGTNTRDSQIRATNNGSNQTTLEFYTSNAATPVKQLSIDNLGNALFTGTIAGNGSGLTTLNASNVSSGTIATARLASGTANANTVLYGDNTWKSIVSGASILNDVATNANYYPMWATTNAGTPTTVYVSNTKLYFNPSTGTLNATIFNSLSDENQKTDIKIINNAQNIINQINGVEFTWKDNGKPSSGVIAQELEKILPNLVDTNENLVKSVNYNGIIAYLIQTVKELDSRIKILENK